MRTRARDRNGFTLIETLVAVAVVAAVSVALQRGFVAARGTLLRAEGIVAAETVARGLLETRLDELARGPGIRDGVTDGSAWTVTSEPLDLPFPPPPPPEPEQQPPAQGGQAQAGQAEGGASAEGEAGEARTPAPKAVWRPLRVRISVGVGSGPPLVIETVHLARAS